MNALGRRHDSVRKTHPPGQLGGNAVIAVAGEKTANSPDSVAGGSGRRTRVEKFEQRNLRAACQENQRRESTQESAEPSESHAAEDVGPWICKKFARAFQHMIETRAGNSCQPRDPDDHECVSLQFAPLEIRIPNASSATKCRRNHQPYYWKGQRSHDYVQTLVSEP